jgi:glycine cleavage system H protein
VQAPAVGSSVKAGGTLGEVESTKSVSDIYAPLSGTVSAANDALGTQPELLNSDPYGAGWICEIELSDTDEISILLDAGGYRALIEG